MCVRDGKMSECVGDQKNMCVQEGQKRVKVESGKVYAGNRDSKLCELRKSVCKRERERELDKLCV